MKTRPRRTSSSTPNATIPGWTARERHYLSTHPEYHLSTTESGVDIYQRQQKQQEGPDT